MKEFYDDQSKEQLQIMNLLGISENEYWNKPKNSHF